MGMTSEMHAAGSTFWNRLEEISRTTPNREAIVHWVSGEAPHRWCYSDLVNAAEEIALSLVRRGIRRGDVCAIIMRHHAWFYPLYLAVVCAGAIPAVLAYPNARLHPDKFRQGIRGMCARSGLDWILTQRDLEETIAPLAHGEASTIKGICFPLEWAHGQTPDTDALTYLKQVHASVGPNDPLLLQHSSGTTGLQKPVLLSHRAVLSHIRLYGQTIRLCENDKIVSWLPLYHDMGLIAAFYLPLASGVASVQMDPFEWVIVPSILLEAISREKGTLCWLPNFAFNLLAEKIRDEDLEGINLASLRMAINCSETVRFDSIEKFGRRFASRGLRPKAVSSCYAMAETTFAVTQTPPGEEVSVLYVDRESLSCGEVKAVRDGPGAKACVSSGKLIGGCSIGIEDGRGDALEDDRVGEVVIRSVSMFDGYRNYPEKTAEVMRSGWYRSGDYGFRHGKDYYIVGRKKDIIIVAGRNIYPEDIEDAVGRVGGVIPGRVVACGEEDVETGSEKVIVIAETLVEDEEQKEKLRMDVVKAGMDMDVSIGRVCLVPPRWLIKSSAGKLSRKANRERILDSDHILATR